MSLLPQSSNSLGAIAFAAAQAMVGTRFRLQGDDPTSGLDCVGLIRAAYREAGVELVGLATYPMRGWSDAKIHRYIAASGLAPRPPAAPAQIGDVVMMSLPAMQTHFALVGETSLVHAHAGLRRVVESPLAFLQPPLRYWYVAQA